ncbi:MAG TPA: hypothetical protein VFP21_12485 [Solirubrobacterales bacterium]|nr:hypothetical protein [Solirubrobacterales bacterium]
MRRQLKGLQVGLVAFVFCAIAPSPASATNTPALTFPTGTLLSVGSKIRGHNTGLFKTTGALGTIECLSSGMTGTLRKNNGFEVEADIESFSVSSTGTGGACTSPPGGFAIDWGFSPTTNGLPWCLRSTQAKMKDDEVQIRGGSCSEASRPIRIAIFTTIGTEGGGVDSIECLYERSSALVGTYTTEPEDALVTFTEAEWLFKSGNTLICPEAWKLDFSQTLELDQVGGGALYIS